MRLFDSEVTCATCGEQMKCLLTGPDSQPHTRATYLCPNMDWRCVCQGAGYAERSQTGREDT